MVKSGKKQPFRQKNLYVNADSSSSEVKEFETFVVSNSAVPDDMIIISSDKDFSSDLSDYDLFCEPVDRRVDDDKVINLLVSFILQKMHILL